MGKIPIIISLLFMVTECLSDGTYREEYQITEGAGLTDFQLEISKDIGENLSIGFREFNKTEKDLQTIIPEMDRTYQGYAEYGHTETFIETKQTEERSIQTYQVALNDGRGLKDESGNPLGYEQQVITQESQVIIKTIEPNTPYDLTPSIFNEKIVLKKPLIKGNKWEETIVYGGNEYKAISEIIDLSENGGEDKYTVVTSIQNIDGFPENTYKEKRVIKEGRGVTSFSNTLPGLTDTLEGDYTFGYGIVTEQN